MPVIYFYLPEKNHVLEVCNAIAIPWLQLMVHVILFPMINILYFKIIIIIIFFPPMSQLQLQCCRKESLVVTAL